MTKKEIKELRSKLPRGTLVRADVNYGCFVPRCWMHGIVQDVDQYGKVWIDIIDHIHGFDHQSVEIA